MTEIEEAMNTLRKAFQEQPDYAYGWHANIAMACYDAIENQTGIKDLHQACNEGASIFMKRAFDVATSQDMLISNDKPGDVTWE